MRPPPPDKPPATAGRAPEAWNPDARSDEQIAALIEITRLEHVIAAAQGAQARAMTDFVKSVEESIPTHVFVANRRVADDAQESAFAEITLALGVAPQTAKKRIETALFLSKRLPSTFDAWCTGDISAAKARTFAEETKDVDVDLAAEVEEKVLPKAAGLTPGKLRTHLKDQLKRLDPEGAAERRKRAAAGRKVVLYPRPDGMAALTAVLPEEQAVAMFRVIDHHAHHAPALGDDDHRVMDEVRADTIVQMILHPEDLTEPRIRYQMRVVVPAGTLLGLNDEPGYLPGHGPLDADLCRTIAEDATWSRLLTDVNNGHVLDLGREKYKPSRPLIQFIQTRDRTCRWPGCRRRAERCDIDHCAAHPEGETTRCNLQCLCRHHHRIKHMTGWLVELDPDDASLTITTPHGQVYRTRPPTPTGPEPPTEPVEAGAEPDD